MLQQVWDVAGRRRVNLLHRLDQAASGFLILSFASGYEDDDVDNNSASIETGGERRRDKKGPKTTFIVAMQSPEAIKTHVYIVHGNGTDKDGNYLTDRGWLAVDDPVKDKNGMMFWGACVTKFRFVAEGAYMIITG